MINILAIFAVLAFLFLLVDSIVTLFYLIWDKKSEHISEERDYWKEKYEQLHLDQIQELLDDRDFGNGN